MARKLNCWEFHKCGREPGGDKASTKGICPASIEISANKINGGESGGRVCWAISGTLCGGHVHGTIAKDIGDCTECEFFKIVRREEGRHFKDPHPFRQ